MQTTSAPASHSKTTLHQKSTQQTSSDTNRVHNLTDTPLPPDLSRVLDMGPKFALSRSINKRVLEDAEIGFERGAFALRWRHFIESQRAGSKTDVPRGTGAGQVGTQHEAQRDATSCTSLASKGDTDQTSTDKTPSACPLIPLFPDTDTKMAPTASH